jgi:hypothetical protein
MLVNLFEHSSTDIYSNYLSLAIQIMYLVHLAHSLKHSMFHQLEVRASTCIWDLVLQIYQVDFFIASLEDNSFQRGWYVMILPKDVIKVQGSIEVKVSIYILIKAHYVSY